MLKTLRLAALLSLSLASAACANTAGSLAGAAVGGPIGGAITAVTGSKPLGDAIVMDEKGMYAAEALYNVPAQAYVSADTRGLVTPALRGTLRPLLIKARAALLAVRAAYKIGDATSFGQRVAALRSLGAEIAPLIPATN